MITESSVAVGTGATLLFSGVGRVVVSFPDGGSNNGDSGVRLGGSSVTTSTGAGLSRNTMAQFDFAESTDLYGIVSSGPVNVRVVVFPLPGILGLVCG